LKGLNLTNKRRGFYSCCPTHPSPQPERIDPQGNPSQYDVRSDVWSFGISMIEISTGRFPYETWRTPFEQLRQVDVEAAPTLPPNTFSQTFEDFINQT